MYEEIKINKPLLMVTHGEEGNYYIGIIPLDLGGGYVSMFVNNRMKDCHYITTEGEMYRVDVIEFAKVGSIDEPDANIYHLQLAKRHDGETVLDIEETYNP